MPINAAIAYQNNKISTATPAELTLMLYEGAIKYCNIAITGIEENNITKTNNNIIKTENIISYLRSTLDFNYPIAGEFEAIYKYIYERLISANIRKEKEIMEEVLEHLRVMRDTWKEVMNQAK
ncbi:flagellar export chaperone FliS [Anaerocolumna sp. AGMB13025]|uniref:flagellar export chaperone FliS n=1 Tax=Anaerocolumna sp. AGMB13025 TaxID=3039116 RepID=UPI00241F0E4E|nr:flagellar export chaperone FliS [Anaerocolumna sp. AGMB13025]WFR56803.1 flagellar export chaperone FliS [Anaerocolumna sp. AGMB13025]